MRISLNITPILLEDGLHLQVQFANRLEMVGPISQDRSHPVVFEEVEERAGPVPPSRAVKRLSTQDEEEIAQDIGGRRQKASGATAHAKGDIRKRGSVRGECKTTRGDRFIVTLDDLNKIRSECGHGEKPVFVISFRDRSTRHLKDRWALQPYEDWRETHIDPKP